MSSRGKFKTALFAGSVFSAFALFGGTAAVAQEAPTADSDGIASDEDSVSRQNVIVVTARKRSENLQEVPISITALDDDALREANAFGLEDVAELTPGLQFRQLGGVSEPVIRGLAQTDQLGLQGNVGVFVDGIFLNNRSSLEFGNLDLAQIEVLKGPQSALFGRNTFAGAINYTTRKAILGEFDAMLEAEAGSHDRLGIKGSVNFPLGENAAIRVFGGTSEFDGTIDNIRGGDKVGGWDERTSYGASGLFEAGRFTVNAFYARNEVDEDQPSLRTILGTENRAGSNYVSDTDPSVSFFTLFDGNIPNFEDVDLFPLGSGNDGYFWLGYINVDVDLDFATLTANYSRSESEYSSLFDNIGDPAAVTQPLFGFLAPRSNQLLTNSTGDVAEQDSFELRLASNEGSAFDWLVGYSYYDNITGGTLSSTVPLITDPSTLEQITSVPERLIAETQSIFGSVNFPVSDQLNIGGELRFTEEDQVVTNELDILIFGIDNDPTETPADFDYWSGRISADYALNDNTLIYGYAARGVKSGGPNPGQTGEFATFDPETNWTYEVGAKKTLPGGRGIINGALYYIDWSDLQTPAPPSLTAGGPVVNGVGASSIGIEIDATYDITDNFNVRGAVSWADPTYDDGFIDAALSNQCGAVATPAGFTLVGTCSDNVGGNQIARASDFSLYLSGTYTVPSLFRDFDGFGSVNFSHEAAPFPTSANLTTPDDRQLTNIRFGLQSDNTEIAFWVDNLFDENVIDRVTTVVDLTTSGALGCGNCVNLTRVYPGNTQTWGVKLVQRF